jgi:hypothetical protein
MQTRLLKENNQTDWDGSYRLMTIRTAMLIEVPRCMDSGECVVRTLDNRVVKDFERGGMAYLLHVQTGVVLAYGWNDRVKVYWDESRTR